MECARAREDINWEFFTLSVDESSYQSALEPLQSMNTALWIAVTVVALAMAILLYQLRDVLHTAAMLHY